MPTLNDHLTWNEVGAIPTGPATRVRDAFWSHSATREHLPAGMRLYKFSSFDRLNSGIYRDDRQRVSPWWSPTLPFKDDIGIEGKKHMADSLGVSLREWARVTSVLNEAWSSVAWILYIQLKVPAYGFYGGFKSLPRRASTPGNSMRYRTEAAGTTKNLPGGGGAYQLYIPGLKMEHVTFIQAEFVRPKAAGHDA